MHLISGLCITALLSLASAIPSIDKRGLKTAVTLVNLCDNVIQVGQLGSTSINGGSPIAIGVGASKTYQFNGVWSGRFWARENCEGSGCQIAGAAFPASLAEFTFHGASGKDYYDISFVDGYNLPLRIDPIKPNRTPTNALESGRYWCTAPTCNVAPSCPPDLQLWVSNIYVGCLSACSKFGNQEYCCSGAHNTPDKCPINMYAASVKNECPDAYSYAYDDATSLFECRAAGYKITWCPK